MEVRYAERCAWRAVYVYRGGRQIAHLGFDPTASTPRVFGGLLRWSFNVRCPHLSWARAVRLRRLGGIALYRVQSRALHALDGRY